LATASDLIIDHAVVRSSQFAGELTDAQESVWAKARASLAAAGWAPPRPAELGVVGELVHALTRRGDLIRVADDLVYLREQMDQLPRVLAELAHPFTVSAFKDALGISRKHAVPLLEWMDRQGLTVRQGDLRRVRS
jgi:selenocysteine-specific elongation factor